jgi:hypothetical protein
MTNLMANRETLSTWLGNFFVDSNNAVTASSDEPRICAGELPFNYNHAECHRKVFNY